MTIQGERLDAVVAEAVAGDRNALREVLETIRPIVVRYCRARVGTVERGGLSADDVAQEVCLAAITALPRYRDRGRPFLAFLYGIAAHKVADAHRAAGRDLAYPAETRPRGPVGGRESGAAGHRGRFGHPDERVARDLACQAARDPDLAGCRRPVGRRDRRRRGQHHGSGPGGPASCTSKVEGRNSCGR